MVRLECLALHVDRLHGFFELALFLGKGECYMEGSDAGMTDSSSDFAAEFLIISKVLSQGKYFLVMFLMRGQTDLKCSDVHDILPQRLLFITK